MTTYAVAPDPEQTTITSLDKTTAAKPDQNTALSSPTTGQIWPL